MRDVKILLTRLQKAQRNREKLRKSRYRQYGGQGASMFGERGSPLLLIQPLSNLIQKSDRLRIVMAIGGEHTSSRHLLSRMLLIRRTIALIFLNIH